METKSEEKFQEYAKIRNQLKWEVKKSRKGMGKSIAENIRLQPKQICKYVNSKRKVKTGISDLKGLNGNDQPQESAATKMGGVRIIHNVLYLPLPIFLRQIPMDQQMAARDTDTAEVLAQFFRIASSLRNPQPGDLPEFENRKINDPFEEIVCNTEVVQKLLLNLNPNKSPGPDTIHPKVHVLKELQDHGNISEPVWLV